MKQLVFVVLTLGALGAASLHDEMEMAYRAYQAGDYGIALQHYDAALKSTTDPGLVAFNQGSVLAAAGRHAEAALAFAQSLEDAIGLRRIKAAYGQGTALTHVAAGLTGRQAAILLQQAMQSFEIAIREAETANAVDAVEAAQWKTDAEHNRTIAQALLEKKQQEPEPPTPTPTEGETDFLDLLKSFRDQGTQPNQPVRPMSTAGEKNGGGIATDAQQTQAGKGNLPPLLDEPQPKPISAEEAIRQLDQALQRINKPLPTEASKPGAKDW